MPLKVFCFVLFFTVILCTFSVLWNNVAVFQSNVSLPHCNGKLYSLFSLFLGLLVLVYLSCCLRGMVKNLPLLRGACRS